MKISFNCTDDQQVVHTHKDAGLSDQVPCSKPDISPEAYLNDYRNRMPFHYIEEGSDGYYYWQYGSIMDLVINFVDEIAQSEDMPEAVLDVRIDDKSVVDPVTGVAHLGSMAVRNTADYYTLQQTDKIVGGLSQQIKDLQEGAVASIVGSSENLMSGQLLMWDSEARRLVGSPLVKGDAEKSIILKTSSSDPNFASHEGAVLLGKGLRSSFPYQFITGFYNKLTPEEIFSVGTGFSDEARSTAFSISRSGKVKVFTQPVDKDDIVRKGELDAVKAIADKAVVANEPITAGTHTKITYDAKGLVTGGSDLAVSDIPELPTSKITSGVFSDDRIASANTWNAKQDALTAQQLSAVDSGITSEKVAAYDGYAETINEKLDKSGGTISGSLVVSENLVVSGTTSTVHTQNLKVTDKLIYVAKDNTTPLTSPAGLITPKYDGINNGGIVYDNTGTAYVGDITLDSNGNVDVNNSDLQPIATRDAAITDGNIVKWDDTNKTLVDSGKALSDLATKEDLQEVSNSNLLYNSDFGIHGSINGPTSEDTIPGWYSGGSYSYVKYDTTKKRVYIRQLYSASYGGPLLSQDLSPSNAYSYPRDFIGGKTFTLSAEFEDINDAGEYELRLIFRPVSNSASDVIHSTPIKNGKVSVTATAPEKSDFGIVAQVYATKGIGVAHKTLMFINYVKLEFGSQATPYLPPLRQQEVWKNTKLLTYRELGYSYDFNSVSDEKVFSEQALNFYFAKIRDVNAKSFTKVYKSVSDLGLKNGASVIDVIKKMTSNKSLTKLLNEDSSSTYNYISGCPADNGILTIYRGSGALNYVEITYQQFISDTNVSNIYTGYPVYSNSTITDIVWHLIENTANKTTTVGPDSTDDQYPTAKAVYDALPKIEIIDNLNSTAADKALSANQGKVLNDALAQKKGASGTGENSEIFNDYTTNKASGAYSHAEGKGTKATATGSHAEGDSTTARTLYAHAEGSETTASGIASHAEGWRTTAKGPYSHAEGQYTYAASGSQHVQGKFNKWDTEGKYAHIVGNGTSNATASLSNAHTLDWEGNAWYAGKVSGGTIENPAPVENDNDYVTKKYFNENKPTSSQIIDADLESLANPITNTYYRNVPIKGEIRFEALNVGDVISKIEIRQSLSTTEMNNFLDGLTYSPDGVHVLVYAVEDELILAFDGSIAGFNGLKLLAGYVSNETRPLSIIYANQDFDLSTSELWSESFINTTGSAGWQLDNGILSLNGTFTIESLSDAASTLNGVVFGKGYVSPYKPGVIYFWNGSTFTSIHTTISVGENSFGEVTLGDNDKIWLSGRNNIVLRGLSNNIEINSSNGVGFNDGDAITNIVFNTSISIEQMDAYLSQFTPIIATGASGQDDISALLETVSYQGLYCVHLDKFGGTGYCLAICNAADTGSFTVLQVVYVSAYSETNQTIIRNFAPDFSYTEGGWQNTSEFTFNPSTVHKVARGNEQLGNQLGTFVGRDSNLWNILNLLSSGSSVDITVATASDIDAIIL